MFLLLFIINKRISRKDLNAMCGFFGVIGTKFDPSEMLINRINKGLQSIEHRGPDGEGVTRLGNAVFGHRRLAIISLDDGAQPFVDNTNRFMLVYNGEIFNYLNLRKELQSLGCEFNSHSDTEVLLQGLIKLDLDFVQKINGMFSFIFYDSLEGRTIVGRDRLGIKPLFYHHDENGRIWFASERKSFYSAEILKFTPNKSRFLEFLMFGFLADDETYDENIYEVLPGEVIDINNNKQKRVRYWYPETKELSCVNDNQMIDQLDRLLQECVESWCVSDVEISSFLSGGIDSSLASYYSSKKHENMKTITAVFPGYSCDEQEQVDKLVKKMNVSPQYVSVTQDFFQNSYDFITRQFDDPILDPNIFTLYAICKAFREISDIKVALCGEGGDELFGGYHRHFVLPERMRSRNVPDVLEIGMAEVAIPRIRSFFPEASFHFPHRRKVAQELRSTTLVNKCLEFDLLTYLPMRLHCQDRMGMLCGLEIRTPLLDHRIVEFAMRLPDSWKRSGEYGKVALRKLAALHLPSEIAWNPIKTPLTFPMAELFREGILHNMFLDLVTSNSRIADMFDIKPIHELLHSHKKNEQDHSNTLWRLLALESWLRYMS